ncbi:MAG: agmatinase [Candidatus Zixiibacteriota bacterium]
MTNKDLFIPHNFLGIPEKYTDLRKSGFVILPIPYEGTSSYKSGTKEGPQAIINASRQVEFYDQELKIEPYRKGICTLNELEPDVSSPEKMVEKIYKLAKELVDKKRILIGLGGEHTISIGLVKAHKEKYKNLSVLQLDAHADLRDTYQNSKYSHACVMKRINEFCDYVGVGIRSISNDETSFAGKEKIKIFSAKDIKDKPELTDGVLDLLSENVYITFDLDFLDPSIIPAVGTPEPGGLLWYETLDFLKKVIENKNIVGLDVVELTPLPGIIAPDFLVAKLLYKIIGYISSTAN